MKTIIFFVLALTITLKAQWECITADFTPNAIEYIKVHAPDKVIVVSNKGEVFLSKDSLKTWNNVFTNPRFNFKQAFFLKGMKAWYITEDVFSHENYEKYYSEDGGLTWNKREFGGDMLLKDIHFFNDSIGYAVFFRGVDYQGSLITRTTNGGESWDTVLTREVPNVIHSVHALTKNDVISSHNDSIFISSDMGATWKATLKFNDEYSRYIQSFDSTTAFIFVEGISEYNINRYGAIYRTTDKGNRWDMVVDSLYYFYTYSSAARGDKAVFTQFFYDLLLPEASGNYGNVSDIVYSTDKGLNWSYSRFPLSSVPYCVDFYNDTTVLFGTNKGIIGITTDFGKTFNFTSRKDTLDEFTGLSMVNRDTGFFFGQYLYKT